MDFLLTSSSISPTPDNRDALILACQEELNRRELAAHVERARADLAYYHRWVMGFPWGRHIQLWCDLLQERLFRRLLIIAPPGHGKTVTVSQSYVTFEKGQHPERLTLLASVTAAQAYLISKSDRDTIEGNERWKATFPGVVPAPERGWSQAEWFIKRADETLEEKRRRLSRKDANLAAFGFDGPVIGRRAHEAVIDDPHDKDNSRTEIQRNHIKAAYDPTLTSRLEGMAASRIVCIMTRWHEDDLAATMLKSGEYAICHMPALSDGPEVYATLWTPEDLFDEVVKWARITYGERMEIVNEQPAWADASLPAPYLRILIHEDGPALWPELISAQDLATRRRINPRDFEKMYQGNPVPDEGRVFRREFFRYYEHDARPPMHRTIQSWDTAFKENVGSAFSVCTTWGHGSAGALLLDVYRERLTWPELYLAVGLSYLLAEQQPQAVLIEDKASGQSAVQAWASGVEHPHFISECQRYLSGSNPKPSLVRMIREMVLRGYEAGAPAPGGRGEREAMLPALADVGELRRHCTAMAWSLPRVVFVPVIPVKVGAQQADKQARAEDAAVWYQSGKVWHPRFAPWLQSFEYELEQCPDGTYWDQIDSTSQAVVHLLGAAPSISGPVGPELLTGGSDPFADRQAARGQRGAGDVLTGGVDPW